MHALVGYVCVLLVGVSGGLTARSSLGALVVVIAAVVGATQYGGYVVGLTLRNLRLCFTWALTLAIMVPVIVQLRTLTRTTTSVVRKFFHFVAVIMFLPPLRQPTMVEFVAVAGVSVAALFMILETARLSSRQFRAHLNRFIHPFLDSKDNRSRFVTSHTQLLLACTAPAGVSIVMGLHPDPLVELSGVLTVGIGDAAAALGGSLMGKRYTLPWSETKTYSGTLAFVVSVLAALRTLGLLSDAALAATLISALTESVVKTYDNLVLPVVFSAVVVVARYIV
jgi:dolichol kinase